MMKNLRMSKKCSTFASSNKKNNNIIMKKINYCNVFVQKLRENKVLGIFCETASDELLSMLFSKKDLWLEIMTREDSKGNITNIAQKLEYEGKDEERGIMKSYEATNLIYDTLEL